MIKTIDKLAQDVKVNDEIVAVDGAEWRLRNRKVDRKTERNNGNIQELSIGGRRYLFGFNQTVSVKAPVGPSWLERKKTALVKWFAKKLGVKVRT